jgi:hypothetical protein
LPFATIGKDILLKAAIDPPAAHVGHPASLCHDFFFRGQELNPTVRCRFFKELENGGRHLIHVGNCRLDLVFCSLWATAEQ